MTERTDLTSNRDFNDDNPNGGITAERFRGYDVREIISSTEYQLFDKYKIFFKRTESPYRLDNRSILGICEKVFVTTSRMPWMRWMRNVMKRVPWRTDETDVPIMSSTQDPNGILRMR